MRKCIESKFSTCKRYSIFTIGTIASSLPAMIMSASTTSLGIFGGSDMQSFVDIFKKTNVVNGSLINKISPIVSPFALMLLVRACGYATGLYKVTQKTCDCSIKAISKTDPYLSNIQKKAIRIITISLASYAYTYTAATAKDYGLTPNIDNNPSNRLGLICGAFLGALSVINLGVKIFKT